MMQLLMIFNYILILLPAIFVGVLSCNSAYRSHILQIHRYLNPIYFMYLMVVY